MYNNGRTVMRLLLAAILLFLPAVAPEAHKIFAGERHTPPHAGPPLSGFKTGILRSEQICSFTFRGDIHVHINAPAGLSPDSKLLLILYALPNGNTLDQTFGKRLQPEDDWHYDIQHAGAQIRFVRAFDPPYAPVLILLQTRQRSWPLWKAAHPRDHGAQIIALTDTLQHLFGSGRKEVMLAAHSGGGRFIFSLIDQEGEIPEEISRIVFIDANYGYEEKYAAPLARWLKRGKDHVLLVLAYNDSLALLNGRRVVSDTGGTWHRSGRMRRDLARYFTFAAHQDTAFQCWSALSGRLQFLLKENPQRAIWHTQQVERNGLIHAMLAGTALEDHGYRYWGERAYQEFIGAGSQLLPVPAIPPRSPGACTGTPFMAAMDTAAAADREEAVWRELHSGNVPDFLRQPILIERRWADAAGDSHQVVFAVLPDYLAIGGDSDYVRMPMTALTAQRVADAFGAILPTRKLTDAIWAAAAIKLVPQFYAPQGDRNERPATFLRHHLEIEQQRMARGGLPGQLTGGHKKDIVLSNLLADPLRPGHLVLYGWHQLDGQPIQPLTNIHAGRYVDYSHGVRLLSDQLLIDGVPRHMEEILADPLLYALISDEKGPMPLTHYPRVP